MNSIDLINQFADTIPIIVSEADGKDIETKNKLILQIVPFFQEILSTITSKTVIPPSANQATSQFLGAISDNIQNFLLSEEDTKKLTTFLCSFISSHFSLNCSLDLTRLIISLITIRKDPQNNLHYFVPVIETYFSINEFRSAFINSCGFESVWCSFYIGESNQLLSTFFDQLSLYSHYYSSNEFHPSLTNLFITINSSISELNSDKCEFIFNLILSLLKHNPKDLYPIIEKVGLMNTLSTFIFSNEDSQINFFTIFISFAKFSTIDMNFLQLFVDIFHDSRLTKAMRHECLDFFIDILKKNTNPFTDDFINQIAISIPHEDTESILKFSDICYFLQKGFNFDLSPIIPTLIQFCSYDLLINNDMRKIIWIFVTAEKKFYHYMSSFFSPLFKRATNEKFAALFNKYKSFYTLFALFIDKNTNENETRAYLKQFLMSFQLFEENQNASMVLNYILIDKCGYQYINFFISTIGEVMKESIDVSIFLINILIKCALTSRDFCLECISQHSIELVFPFYANNLPSENILNFVSAITMKRYIPKYEFQVKHLMKQFNNLNETPENLLYLVLGLQIGEDNENASLCFPSLLHCCPPYSFSSPFDLWLCANISLDIWLTESKEDIKNFPSIHEAARQFLFPKHMEMIVQNPILVEQILKGPFTDVPLFEFPPLKTETKFDLIINEPFKSLSFWIYYTELKSQMCTIVSFSDLSLNARDDKFYIGTNEVSTINRNKWILLTFNHDENTGYSFYIDNKLVHTFSGNSSAQITFGSENNCSRWYIGGAIRGFKESLTDQKIETIQNYGPSYLEQFDFKDSLLYSPYDIAPLFQPINNEKLQSCRPVTIYSLLSYIVSSLRGTKTFIMKAIDMISNPHDIQETKSVITSICLLHKCGSSLCSNDDFSTFMSIICNYDSPAITADLIDTISHCFVDEKNEKFDWDSFLNFALDYKFFLSDLAINMISLIFQFTGRFPIPQDAPYLNIFNEFLLSLLLLPEFKNEYKINILDLIKVNCKNPSLIIRTIASEPKFAEDLTDYSTEYTFIPNETILSLLDIFLSLPIKQFNEYYILRLFEPTYSFKIIEHVMKSCLDQIDEMKIISYCSSHISFIQAWEIMISIFLRKQIRLDDIDFDYSAFNIDHFTSLLMILPPLIFIACRLNINNFWNRLCCKLLNLATSLISTITYSPKIKFYVLSMLSLGYEINQECLFPLCHSLSSEEEIVEYSVTRGQVFPENSQPNQIDLDIPFSLDSKNVMNLSNVVPSKIFLTTKRFIPFELKLKELSYLITSNQQPQEKVLNWNSYLSKLYHDFGIENFSTINIENSNIITHLTKFLIELFSKYSRDIEMILFCSTIFPYKMSCFWMQHLSIELLQIFEKKSIINLPFISFVSQRLLEGWYSSMVPITLSTILSLIRKKSDLQIPESLYFCILYSMDLVHSDQVPIIGDIIAEYSNLLLRPAFYEKCKYVKIFLSRGMSYIPFLNSTFSKFWLKYIKALRKSDSLKNKWNQEYEKFPFLKVLDGFEVLGKKGIKQFNDYKSNDPQFWENFEIFLNQHFKKFQNKLKIYIAENINRMITIRKEETSSSRIRMERHLMFHELIQTNAKAIAVSVRYFVRRSLLARCEFYIRKRERVISSKLNFNDSKSERYSLSILSDPIYPTRRITKSPLEYQTPIYPSGTPDDIFKYHPNTNFDYTYFPNCVYSCIYSCRYRIPSLLRRSPNAIHARYAGIISLLPSIDYQIFLCVYNDGRKFDFHCDASLLFGVDVLEGIVLINNNYLFFAEGLTIRDDDKLFHTHAKECPISQEIYIQLFQSRLLASRISNYHGHFVLITELSQIIAATNHLWLQRPYSITLNYSTGYNFVLNFSSATYNDAYSYIKKGLTKFFESAPPITPYLSPIRSAYLLQENLKKLTQMWIDGDLDNFTYLSLVNRFGKRCFADLTQYPVFPWTIADYSSDSLPMTRKKIAPIASSPLPITGIRDNSAKSSSSQEIIDVIKTQSSDTELPSISENESSILAPQMDESSEESCNEMNEESNQLNNNSDSDKIETQNHQTPLSQWYRDLAKPMGQLNEERAKKFEQIFQDADPHYYYGTHYLHYGVVVYFLFRIDPFSVYFFILHHGWDHPNRVFLKMNETWLSASMKSQSDVKELIPQLYKVPDYLTNVSNFPFAQDGVNIATVELPKWAANPHHFVLCMCKYFESKYITRHLNFWIDLIFGVNSRGQGALNSKNLFHPTCYPESCTDMEDIDDPVEKQAFITSIINFGQISPQIFTKPHPRNFGQPKRRSSHILSANEGGTVIAPIHLLSNVRFLVFQKLSNESLDLPILDFLIGPNDIIFASSKNLATGEQLLSFLHPIYPSRECSRAKLVFNRNIVSNPSTKIPPYQQSFRPPLFKNKRSSFNNLADLADPSNSSHLLRSKPIISFDKRSHVVVLPSLQTYESHQMTLVSHAISRDGFLLCEVFADGHIEICRLNYSKNGSAYSSKSKICNFHTPLGTGACDISSEHFIAFVAHDTSVYMFDIGTRKQIQSSIELNYKVTNISIDDEASVVWIAGGCNVTVCSISGEILFETILHNEITTIYASPLPEYIMNRFASVGHQDGSVSFLGFSYQFMKIIILHRIRISEQPILRIKVHSKANRAIAVAADNTLFDFEYIGTPLKPLDIKYAAECANCNAPLKGGFTCSSCNRFLCSKCVAKDSIKGVKFVHYCQICSPKRI